MKFLMGSMLGIGGALMAGVVQADPNTDPVIGILQDELAKSIPSIAQTKSQIEAITGHAVGPATILIALFIVFCGRQVMQLMLKGFDLWAEERRADRDVRIAERAKKAGATYTAPAPQIALPASVAKPAGT